MKELTFSPGGEFGKHSKQYPKELTTVLSWDPAGQTWKEAGNLTVPRSWHAAVAVPLAFGREMEDSAPECHGEDNLSK